MKTCGHVSSRDKKKASGKLFWHAGGPEKQSILFAWPYMRPLYWHLSKASRTYSRYGSLH